VRRKDGEAGSSWLVLLWSTQSPKGNGSSTELGEPALQLRLSGVMGEAGHVQHLAALGKEGPHVGSSIHGASEHIRVFMRRL